MAKHRHLDRSKMARMKRPPEGLAPVVALDRRRARPLHRQLYDALREAILDGRLRPGQRLPSTRTLAQDFQVSRIPAVMAFAQLVAEGYVESRGGAGSFVSAVLPDARPSRVGREHARKARPGPRRVPPSRLAPRAEPWFDLRGPFRVSQPALAEFPAELWARLVARHARRMSPRQMAYGDAMGLPALRAALAAHLRTVRSVTCAPEQIMIVSGSQQALALAGQALLAPGDAVWLEEPGYPGARDALNLAGARIVHVPVDGDGLDVARGIARRPDARAAYVTPSHQYPLGVIMSAQRRLQLLEWARRRGAWLLEDDYDSECRYDGQPLASLHGLDGDARVLYIGTFSKFLFPALRVGYLVLPEDLVERFRLFRGAMDLFPSPLHQAVLAEFLGEGHFARHLRRMRGIYAGRRRALEAALLRDLGDTVRIVGDRAGMHLVAMLPPGTRDHDIAVRAARRGISVIPLSCCYGGRRSQPGLVLGYGSTPEDAIPEAVRRLASVLRA
jgi:GntR family transcriptional regulator/MocR family aminotransferase